MDANTHRGKLPVGTLMKRKHRSHLLDRYLQRRWEGFRFLGLKSFPQEVYRKKNIVYLRVCQKLLGKKSFLPPELTMTELHIIRKCLPGAGLGRCRDH